MHAHVLYTREDSNTTNSSGCTEQTDVSSLSGGDVTSASAYNPKAYPAQGAGYLDEKRFTSAVGTNHDLPRQNTCCSSQMQFENGGKPFTRQQSETFSQGRCYAHERAPLLGDDWVREECRRFFRSEYDEIIKLKKNYKNLRKMFIILALLCIVLIICVISVLPVILVSFKMGNSPDTNDKSSGTLSTMTMEEAFKNFMFRELRSQIAKGIIRKHIFCDKCQERGRNAYGSKGFGDPDELECCQENVFDDFTTFKDTFTEKLQSYFKDIQDLSNRIFEVESEVIRLQHNGNKSEGNITSTSPPGIFAILQNRVALNNNLLNQLLSQKRSSIQLKGTAKSNAIEWQQDITNGDIFSTNNNELHVQSGGKYYLYTNIQFKKNNCTDGEVFEYRIFQNRDGYKRIIAHVKQTCMGFPNSFAISLNFQKVVDVRQGESFSMTVSSHSLSLDPWTHVFGLIEI